MTKEIQNYEPQLTIELKNGRQLLTPLKNKEAILSALETRKFIEIEGVIINTLEIKTVEQLRDDYDVLVGLNEDQRNRAVAEFKESKRLLGKEPTREMKLKKIARILGAVDQN